MPLCATIRRQKFPAPSAHCDFPPRDIGCLLSYVTHRRTAVTQQLLLANASPRSARQERPIEVATLNNLPRSPPSLDRKCEENDPPMNISRRQVGELVLCFVELVALCLPAIINQSPIIYADT